MFGFLNFFNTLIIFDGFISTLGFFKSYISYKLNTPLIDRNQKENYDKIIQKSKIYNLPVIERHCVYGLISLMNIGIERAINIVINEEIINYIYCGLITLPFLQNLIFNNTRVNRYINKRNLFFRYSFSKMILNYISRLNPKITGIKNYHTFILSRHIKWNLVINTFKTFLFIVFLHILRDNEYTYYYYKAIKLSYFYNKGYLFNVMNKENAINIINQLIKEKKWGEINNEQNSNAFYCLIMDNMSQKPKIDFSIIEMIFLLFASLWSIFCFVNLMEIQFIAINMYIFIIIIGSIFEIFTIKFAKKVLISGIVAFSISYLYVNELLLTILYFSIIYNSIPYNVLKECLFFIKNHKNIEKVIEFYDKKEI